MGRTGKNLIPITLTDIKNLNQSGTWSGNTYTLFDIAFTVNTDSAGRVVSITANGTHAGGDVGMVLGEVTFTSGVSYKVSSGTNNSANTTYRIWTVSSTAYPVGHRFTTDRTLLGENVASEARATETCKIQYQIMAGYTANNMTVYPMIYYADIEDTTYEPYMGSVTVTIQLGQTIYGGTLDVLTGVLTITHAYTTITEFTGKSGSTTNNAYYKTISDIKHIQGTEMPNIYSDKYKAMPYNTVTAGDISTGIGVNQFGNVVVGFGLSSEIDTLEKANIWATANPIQVVYELATPTTVQLTANTLTMLKGVNSLSTDSGDVITVTAYAINEEVGA